MLFGDLRRIAIRCKIPKIGLTIRRYEFYVVGYVAMPEPVHLFVSEPAGELLSAGIQALKLSVARRGMHSPIWQARYYDFNVFTEAKRIEKLKYMHWNPVKRGLVGTTEEWPWSSYGQYRTGEGGRVTIEIAWQTHWATK